MQDKQKTLIINPRFEKAFPPLSEDEFATLEANLKKDGCIHAIVTWKDAILDGHHRYKICTAHNIPFKTLAMEFATEDHAELWLRQFARGRRNMTDFVKIENAERLLVLMGLDKKWKESSKEEKKEIAKRVIPDEREDRISLEKVLAKKAKVSHGQVFAYNYIKDKVDEQTKDDLRKGNKTLKEVFKKEHTKAYREREDKKKSTAAVEIVSTLVVGLHHNDILDAPVKDESLDVIITDPPYPREFLDCWKKLAQFALKKLKKNGILLAMSGQSYLPDVYKNMTLDGLDYYWTGCIYTPGTSPNLQEKRLRTNWKPFFIYTKGGYGKRTFQGSDVYVSEYKDTAQGQEYHKWGQSYPVFDQIVKDYTYTDDVVCDPFLGGGTCAIACLDNKRKFVGVELDKITFNTASSRIHKFVNKTKGDTVETLSDEETW